MDNPKYITHEMYLEKTTFFKTNHINKAYDYFESISSIERSGRGKFIIVTGIVHLYGNKIEGNGSLCGFYDVKNDRYYRKDEIENARIIECEHAYSYEKVNKLQRILF